MAKKEDTPAKRAVIREFDAWAGRQPDPAHLPDAIVFFTHLQRERLDLLLDFKSYGDKWQAVHGWLLREGRVKE
jgi:hypothetical protein